MAYLIGRGRNARETYPSSQGSGGGAQGPQGSQGPQGPQGVGTGPVSGDLRGNLPAPLVQGFQGTAIQNAVPAQSEVYVYDGTPPSGQFTLRRLTAADIAAAFALSVGGSQTVEIGASIVNPAFTVAYSNGTPSSASATNSDNIDSPLTLTTPYTNFSFTGTFTHATQTSVSVGVTAMSGTQSASGSAALNFFPRAFAGLGAAGATSATASGTTAILNGGAGTLANQGLAASIVNQVFGPFSPVNQVLYVLCLHTATPHTWKDPATGFAFSMNAPITFSFTNDEGVALSYDLYQSTNLFDGSQSVQCAS